VSGGAHATDARVWKKACRVARLLLCLVRRGTPCEPRRGAPASTLSPRSPLHVVPLLAPLLDYLVRLVQECRGERQAESLRRLQVDYQGELVGPFHGQVGWCGAFKDLVHKDGGALA
jgi:hypothetical protein